VLASTVLHRNSPKMQCMEQDRPDIGSCPEELVMEWRWTDHETTAV